MKCIKIVVISCMLSVAAMAQETETNFKLGFTISPNISWLSGGEDNFKSGGASIGYSYGVLADIGFAKNYFFSTAFRLTTLNSAGEKLESAFEKYHLQYIDIPFTLKLKSHAENSPRLYGQFGLGAGIKVSAKGETKPYGSQIYSARKDISSAINLFRLGLLAGAGTEWNISRNLTVVTGVSFSNPFTNAFDGGSAVKNPYTTLQLGVFF